MRDQLPQEHLRTNGRWARRIISSQVRLRALNLLSTNLGIDDPHQVWPLVALVDRLGLDATSVGTTIAYVLDYNGRHPDAPILNGTRFGDVPLISELIERAETGRCPEVGRGVKRLSDSLGERDYAMHVKGLELPAYLPDTNPGYPWAITERALYFVRDDLLGLCKFATLNIDHAPQALRHKVGLEIGKEELLAAVRRAYIRALWLGRKQGYVRADYRLPSQVFDSPNPALKLSSHPFVTPQFFDELSRRVWAVFDKGTAAL